MRRPLAPPPVSAAPEPEAQTQPAADPKDMFI